MPSIRVDENGIAATDQLEPKVMLDATTSTTRDNWAEERIYWY
jgi:hypothetical protein